MPNVLQIVLLIITMVCGSTAQFSDLIKDEKAKGITIGAFFASFICLIASVIFL